MSPGNSGGPVVDSEGRVVGIVSMKVSGEGVEGIGLAIPINYVYGSPLGFVGPPSSAAAASATFKQMVARALAGADDGIREARADAPEEAPASDDRPLLVAGHVDQYDRLVVRVVRITDFPPAFEEITVTVWSGLDAFCTVKGDIATWTQMDPCRPPRVSTPGRVAPSAGSPRAGPSTWGSPRCAGTSATVRRCGRASRSSCEGANPIARPARGALSAGEPGRPLAKPGRGHHAGLEGPCTARSPPSWAPRTPARRTSPSSGC